MDSRTGQPEAWILVSSPADAALPAELGLPAAFACHIRPQHAVESIFLYRRSFQPSRWSKVPWVMLAVQTICADTEPEMAALARPIKLNRDRRAFRKVDQPIPDTSGVAAYEFSSQRRKVR